MRQLDRDRLFLGLRGCLWARHGRVCFLFRCKPKWLPRPGFGPSQRDFPAEERVYRRRTEDSVRVAGACVALGRAISCKREPSILVSGEQLAGAKEESIGDRERYSEETIRAMASSKEARPSR